MRLRVRATATALNDLVAIGGWIVGEGAPVAADRWIERTLGALASLSEMPLRCAVAPESAEVGREVRHLLLDDYRVLFVAEEGEVVVLHIRHGSRQTATIQDLAAALGEVIQ